MSKEPEFKKLEAAAITLVDEIWGGKWDHVAEVKDKPIDQWTVMPAELMRRCPGYDPEQYRRIITKGMITFH